MKLKIEQYIKQVEKWPTEGRHIMAQYDDKEIVVYQSYRNEIGLFATENQYFGGAFSLNRMTWIKPNFLWMMYRNGWGQKAGQEVTLAIHLKLESFIDYLKRSVYSSYDSLKYENKEVWKEEVERSSVRLQWDPDHDPYGMKLERRAIQIGLRNDSIKYYAKGDIIKIEDISSFVAEQYEFVQKKELGNLMTPKERPLFFDEQELNEHLNLEYHEHSTINEN